MPQTGVSSHETAPVAHWRPFRPAKLRIARSSSGRSPALRSMSPIVTSRATACPPAKSQKTRPPHPFRRQLAQIWRDQGLAADAAEIRVALVVADDSNDIRLRAEARSRKNQEEKGSHARHNDGRQ